MGIVIRQTIYSTFFSYIGVAIGYVNVLWWFPYVLTPQQIGLYRVMHDLAILCLPFAQFSFNESIIKFLPNFTNQPQEKSAFMGFVVVLVSCIYILFTLLFFILRGVIAKFFYRKIRFINQLFTCSVVTYFCTFA